jgi:precorrin-6B C5,15-methyltransferase / cobalt-precorrin-6B C5,C15-methyltransferase
MEDIFACLFEKNEDIRIIINAIALETLAQVLSAVEKFKLKEVEIVQVNISKSKKVANYNMMTGQNPIYIITCQKGKTDNA